MEERTWTEDEEIYLEYFMLDPDHTFKEAADFLGRTVTSVSAKVRYMRKRSRVKRYMPTHRPWSEKEIQFLKRRYCAVTNKEIAISLSRTERSVRKKAIDIGLRKSKQPRLVGAQIKEFNRQGLNSKQIGEKLGLPAIVVHQWCNRNGVEVIPVPKEESQATIRRMEGERFYGIKIRKAEYSNRFKRERKGATDLQSTDG